MQTQLQALDGHASAAQHQLSQRDVPSTVDGLEVAQTDVLEAQSWWHRSCQLVDGRSISQLQNVWVHRLAKSQLELDQIEHEEGMADARLQQKVCTLAASPYLVNIEGIHSKTLQETDLARLRASLRAFEQGEAS